jgi:NADPH2:quinone reductase
MKAVRIHGFGGPEVLKLEDVPDPQPGPGQVLIRVAAVGVNPVDTYIRAGQYGPKPFPYTPGTDVAGTVESVGEGVTTARVGDRVYAWVRPDGASAEQAVCPSADVHALPPRLSFAQGAAIAVPYATAYRALFIRGQAKPHETVLIHGASGSVGLAAAQLAVARGCVVIGTAGSEAGLDLVCRQGVALTLNHRNANYLDRLTAFTAGRGVNLILEMLANVNLDSDLGLLAKHGRVVVIGSRGRVEIDPRQTMQKDSDIRGMSLMHADAAELAMIHAALVAGFTNGTLTPVVAKQFPLAEAAAAHEAVMNPGAGGKVVLVP